MLLTKGKDEIPNGKYILRIKGDNWPNKSFARNVRVSDGEKEQWVEFEGDWIYRMSQIGDGSTFEPTDFDDKTL